MDFGDFVLTDRPRTHRGDTDYPRAALFDLDGTLIDSLPDITLAIGELLTVSGAEPYSEADVRRMVGHGLRPLVERAVRGRLGDVTPAEMERQIELMRDIYPRHLTGRTRLMPNAREALDELEAAGSRLALVTNKLQSAANAVMDHFALTGRFRVILGDQGRPSGLMPKPAPDMLQFTLARLETQPADAIMVGDSEADVSAARAAGIYAVALRNGYSTVPVEELGADIVIDHLGEMHRAIDGWRRR